MPSTNHPIFVLEGPDGSGKSTFAKSFLEVLGPKAKYLHLTNRFRDKMFTYHTAGLERCLRLSEDGPVVLDRWWPSELIYSATFRGGSKWPMGGRLLDRIGMKYSVNYVFFLPDKDIYLENFKTLNERRPKKGIGRDMHPAMEECYDRYWDMFEGMRHRTDVWSFDFASQETLYIAESLIDAGYARKRFSPGWWDTRHERLGAGNHHGTRDYGPRVLLVGDTSNPKVRRGTWPFMEHSNSSLFVTEALEKAQIPEDMLLWSNAYRSPGDETPDPRLMVLCQDFQPEYVVALGDRAIKACRFHGIPISKEMNHPQYYRRFRHHEPWLITDPIKKLIWGE